MVSSVAFVFPFIFCQFLFTQAENETYTQFSIPLMGQEVANAFIGAVWGPLSGGEFVGGVADLYQNKIDKNPVVSSTLGDLRGFLTKSSRNGTPYAAYMGIPFAKPPLKNLRFKAPVEAEPWDGVWDATWERHTCLTFREPNKGSEDCLYLNIFSPSTEPEIETRLKPVMFFIYGGAFMGGSSNTSGYAPDFLIDRDVVVVTFNYRLGPIGFLSLQNEKVPGNAGLKDQTMALRWVGKNIQNFGGDPKRITIFGESAGSASVGYHVISPLSAGLFHRAIMESGTPLATWAYTDPQTAFQKAFLLGSRVGCTFPAYLNRTDELYECLRDTPGPLLMRVQQAGLSIDELLSLRPLAFVPTSEPDLPGAHITKNPEEYLKNGDFNKVPTFTGMNTAEGLLFYPALKRVDPFGAMVAVVGQDLVRLAPAELTAATDAAQRAEIHKRMQCFYTGRTGPTSMATTLQILHIIGDTQFLLPFLKTAKYIYGSSNEKIYNYVFTFDGKYASYKAKENMESIPGTAHMDELGYLFNLGPLENIYDHSDRTKSEEVAIDLMTKIWTDFADSGIPSLEWVSFTTNSTNYCDIGTQILPSTSYDRKAVTFWNEIYQFVRNEKPFPE